MLDLGIRLGGLALLLLAYVSSIFLLGFLLFRYLNLPSDKKIHSFFD
jgi:hypothetical protein